MWEVHNHADLSEVYERLLKPSFPRDELTDLTAITMRWREGTVDLVVASDDDGAPVAVAVGHYEPDSEVVLLSWLAVSVKARGQGLGTELLKNALLRWQNRWHPRLILAEVEHPDKEMIHPDFGSPVDRVRFYGRFNARVLDIPYFQPRIRITSKRVTSMMLITLYDASPGRDFYVEAAPVRLWLGENMSQEPRDAARARVFDAVSGEYVATMPINSPADELPGDGGLWLPGDPKPLRVQLTSAGIQLAKFFKKQGRRFGQQARPALEQAKSASARATSELKKAWSKEES